MQELSRKEKQIIFNHADVFYTQLTEFTHVQDRKNLLAQLFNQTENDTGDYAQYAWKQNEEINPVLENNDITAQKKIYFLHRLKENDKKRAIKEKVLFHDNDQLKKILEKESEAETDVNNIKAGINAKRRQIAGKTAAWIAIIFSASMSGISALVATASLWILAFLVGPALIIPLSIITGIGFISRLIGTAADSSKQGKQKAWILAGIFIAVALIGATVVGLAYILPLIAPLTLGLMGAMIGVAVAAVIVFLTIAIIMTVVQPKAQLNTLKSELLDKKNNLDQTQLNCISSPVTAFKTQLEMFVREPSEMRLEKEKVLPKHEHHSTENDSTEDEFEEEIENANLTGQQPQLRVSSNSVFNQNKGPQKPSNDDDEQLSDKSSNSLN